VPCADVPKFHIVGVRDDFDTAYEHDLFQEWSELLYRIFQQGEMRDMGTHLCALPTGEHCPRGLICLGCIHAQPKKSAVPIFRRMLASHQRSLSAAHDHNEPAGQIASRELEIVRIRGALQRAEELSDDVAAAIEPAL
jgi:hypothetical protein